MERSARLSDDGLYRYVLVRRWAKGGRFATFVMLNPSIANAERDDPTILRCIGFAKSWGMSALHVVNLYALISTDPKGLWTAVDPVGPENDKFLAGHAVGASTNGMPLVAAWGANARPDRVEHVLGLPGMVALRCLDTTLAGAPKHPLARGKHRIPDDAPLREYPPLEPDEANSPEQMQTHRTKPTELI